MGMKVSNSIEAPLMHQTSRTPGERNHMNRSSTRECSWSVLKARSGPKEWYKQKFCYDIWSDQGEGTNMYELMTHSLHHWFDEGLKREKSYPWQSKTFRTKTYREALKKSLCVALPASKLVRKQKKKNITRRTWDQCKIMQDWQQNIIPKWIPWAYLVASSQDFLHLLKSKCKSPRLTGGKRESPHMNRAKS